MITTRKILISHFVAKEKLPLTLAFLAALINSLLNVILPLSIGKFYDLALQNNSVKGQLLEKTGIHIHDLSSFFVLFFILVALRGVFAFLEFYFTDLSEEKLSFFLRDKLFTVQLNHSVTSFKTRPVGKYLLRYSGDLNAAQNYLSKGRIKFIADCIFMGLALTVLTWMDIRIGIIVVAMIISGILITKFLAMLQKPWDEKRRGDRSSLMQFVENRFNLFLTIKVFNRETPELEQFRKKNNTLYLDSKKYLVINALMQSLLPLLFFTGIGAILIVSIPGNGEANSSGYLLISILLLLYMQSVFKRLLRLPFIWSLGKSSLENLLKILNLPSEIKTTNQEEQQEIKGNIAIESLQFGYNPNQLLFENKSCTFNAGTITCIIGPHGSGKSSLIKLLLAIISPTSGSIKLDGRNYNDLTPHEIRKNITLVSDEVPLIGSSVFSSISYSRKEEKRFKAQEILKELNLVFSPNPNENLDYPLDTGATNISSGERKMLQYARAFLTRKKVLLLDEPFDNLDTVKKEIIIDKLNTLRKKRTIIITCREFPSGISPENIIHL